MRFRLDAFFARRTSIHFARKSDSSVRDNRFRLVTHHGVDAEPGLTIGIAIAVSDREISRAPCAFLAQAAPQWTKLHTRTAIQSRPRCDSRRYSACSFSRHQINFIPITALFPLQQSPNAEINKTYCPDEVFGPRMRESERGKRAFRMPKKRFSAEQIVVVLRQIAG